MFKNFDFCGEIYMEVMEVIYFFNETKEVISGYYYFGFINNLYFPKKRLTQLTLDINISNMLKIPIKQVLYFNCIECQIT
jgi:hypothetical protein